MNKHFYLFLLRGFHRPPALCLSPSPAFSLTSVSRLTTQKHLWGQNRDVVSSEYMAQNMHECRLHECDSSVSTWSSQWVFYQQSYWVKCQTKNAVSVCEGLNEFIASGDLSSWASKNERPWTTHWKHVMFISCPFNILKPECSLTSVN